MSSDNQDDSSNLGALLLVLKSNLNLVQPESSLLNVLHIAAGNGISYCPDSSIYTLVVQAKSRALHFVVTEIQLGFSPGENDIKFAQSLKSKYC
jgi:hypothetical protein